MKRFLLLHLAGVLGYVLAFPPVDLFPAALLALAALGMAYRKRMGWREWLVSYVSGLCLFAIGCSWIAVISFDFLLFMAVAEGLALPLFALIYRRMVLKRDGSPTSFPLWLALPLAWVATEYLRTIFPLDGFPWLILGYTLWRCPPLIQVADITGVYGLSFLLAMGGGLAAAWIIYWRSPRESGKRPFKGTLVFACSLAAVMIYGFVRPALLKIEGGPVVAGVQANLPQELKNNSASGEEIFDQYKEATRPIFSGEGGPVPNLLVWAETVYPHGIVDGDTGDLRYQNKPDRPSVRNMERMYIKEDIIRDMLSPHDTWFLVGAEGFRSVSGGVVEERNGAFLYDPSGVRRNEYFKTILVPGGEYLPLIDHVPPGVADAVRSYAKSRAGFLPDLQEGFGPVVMQIEAEGMKYRFGVQICYENIYGDYCRRFVRDGADFLINISNEGWFKTSSEFDQMLAMSVFRAVETRRSLFRCTNTGISCLIGPKGGVPGEEDRIVSEGRDRAVQGVLIEEVPICRSRSLYTAMGDVFARAVFFVLIGILLFLLFKPP